MAGRRGHSGPLCLCPLKVKATAWGPRSAHCSSGITVDVIRTPNTHVNPFKKTCNAQYRIANTGTRLYDRSLELIHLVELQRDTRDQQHPTSPPPAHGHPLSFRPLPPRV